MEELTLSLRKNKFCRNLLQIGGNYAWGPETLDLKVFRKLMRGCRIIDRSKINIKVYYRPVGSDRPTNAKLYTTKKLV